MSIDFTKTRLVESPYENPNAGRVQVSYSDQWWDVCHGNNQVCNREWSFSEAMVICRQLGYPGTAMTRKGGYGNATGSAISSFSCDGGKYCQWCLRVNILLNKLKTVMYYLRNV